MKARQGGARVRAALVGCTLAALSIVAVMLGCKGSRASEQELTLAVAASMRSALPALAARYEAGRPGVKVHATYGASGDLRRQVEGGAPIDGVIFANAQPVDDLIASGRVDAATRKVLATNALVLIGPKGASPLTFDTIDAVPPGEKIAIGDPGAVPAGQYARAALQKLGKWDAVKGRLVFGGDVAAVLAYARRGEVAAAIVYRTDVREIEGVTLFEEAKGDWAPRVEVVGGAVKAARASAEAAAFLEFVASPDGQKILRELGFGPP